MTGISGVHALIYSSEPDQMRAFFRDVLELPSVDAGGGWLIFALPPAEVAVHPIDGAGHHELVLMCDDIHATVADGVPRGAYRAFPTRATSRPAVAVLVLLPRAARARLVAPHFARLAVAWHRTRTGSSAIGASRAGGRRLDDVAHRRLCRKR